MKVFISQPMRGKSDEEILAERNKAIQYVKKLGNKSIEIIDSFFQGAPVDAKPLWYLGKSLELLSEADLAIFLPGYENARGCVIEHTCCLMYDIPHLELPY